jgi:hypothetical protein
MRRMKFTFALALAGSCVALAAAGMTLDAATPETPSSAPDQQRPRYCLVHWSPPYPCTSSICRPGTLSANIG